MKLKRLQSWLQKHSIEVLIVLVTGIVGAIYSYYVYTLGLTLILVDQKAHLNIARQIFDSMTPGVSQIGFWPPILHILLSVPSLFTELYQTGLAASLTLVPLLIMSALFTYRIVLLFSNNTSLSLAGVAMLVLNPYVLYYSVTPMTELIFITGLLGTIYYLLLWFKHAKLSHIIALGIFVALAGLSRFEGFLLIPAVLVILGAHLIVKKSTRSYIEATLILFFSVAAISIGLTFLYSLTYGNTFFAFADNTWSASAQQKDFYLPAQGSIVQSFLYMFHASYHMLGKLFVWLALVATVVLTLVIPKHERVTVLSVVGISITPFLFYIAAMYQGSIVLYLPELAPFESFFNERYGLALIVYTVLIPVITLGYVIKKIQRSKFSLSSSPVMTSSLIGLSVLIVHFFTTVAITDQLSVVSLSASNTQNIAQDQIEVAHVLRADYDHGQILITRALNNYVPIQAEIPLKRYIQESNYRYYEQAVAEPWFFARYVVMFNTETYGEDSWRSQNESISKRWGHEINELERYYDVLVETDTLLLYKINDDRATNIFQGNNLKLVSIPSINNEITTWDALEIKKEIFGDAYTEDQEMRSGMLVYLQELFASR